MTAATAATAAADVDLMEGGRGVFPPNICGGNR